MSRNVHILDLNGSLKIWFVTSVHDKAEKMIRNRHHLHYGDMMVRAMNYIMNGWDELLNYRKDGEYTIDYMLAEALSFLHREP